MQDTNGVPPGQSSSKDELLWKTTFPENVESSEDSAKFIERCILLGTTMLLQSRGLLPADIFKKRFLTSVCRCWVPNNHTTIGKRLMNKLQGVMEALKNGYLKEFFIVVGTNENNLDEAEEVFCWKISYGPNGISAFFAVSDDRFVSDLHYQGMAHLKEQIIELLSRIRKLCKGILSKLPSNAFPSFRVTYVEGVTPTRWQAPGFYRAENLYTLDPRAQAIALGGVATKNHKICLSVSSIHLEDEMVAVDQINSSLLNETAGNNNAYDLLEQSFGSVVNIKDNEDIEEPRGDVSMSPVNPSPLLKRRGVAVASDATVAQKGRALRQRKAVQEIVKKVPKPLTPGKSYRIDQTTPDKLKNVK